MPPVSSILRRLRENFRLPEDEAMQFAGARARHLLRNARGGLVRIPMQGWGRGGGGAGRVPNQPLTPPLLLTNAELGRGDDWALKPSCSSVFRGVGEGRLVN